MYTRNHASVRQAAIETARTWVTRDFVILDTETTGLYSPARIVEISCIDREGNVLVDSLVNPGIPIPADASAIHGISDADVADRPSFSDLWPLVWDAEGNVLVDSLVNPGIPIPADASAIHGISDADVADRPSFSDLWPLVWDAVRSADCVLIYNASYDCRLLRQSLEGHEAALAQAGQLTCGCIMELYAQFYGQYSEYHGSYTWQKLVNAVGQCGLHMDGTAHRALADTRASLAVLKYLASMAD